jgi:TRAP-type C4-dicarboxylate transport system permease small subunit
VTSTASNILSKLLHYLHKLEDSIIVILLSSMLGFAVLQIILRNVFHSGIQWSDSFLRILVLWLGLIGAMIASRDGKHINIDLLSRYLSEKLTHFSTVFCQLFTSVISALVAYYSFLFVLMEKESGDIAFASIPLWFCESIIPFAFATISIRYLILMTKEIFKI